MAECNYDEVTHSIYPPENPDPMYHWDAHFPERLSRLHLSLEFSSPVFRRSRRAKERSSGRYKTQPITFDEITEVDEDTSGANQASSAGAASAQGAPDNRRESKGTSFRHQVPGFFSRSVDGLVASGYVLAKSGTSTGSDKENTPCDPDRIPELCSTEEEDENRPSQQGTNFSGLLEGESVGPPADVIRHRRKRSGRRLRNRNAVPEEVTETDKME